MGSAVARGRNVTGTELELTLLLSRPVIVCRERVCAAQVALEVRCRSPESCALDLSSECA